MSALEHFPRITPFLWFDPNAEKAVDFYPSIFKNSRGLEEVRNLVDGTHAPKGGVLAIAFELRWSGVYRVEWRSQIQIHGRLICGASRHAARSG